MKIVIDGLIGAGKSTQVDILSKITGKSVIKEPIGDWPLELFYKDPSRWGFMMQVAVLNSYVKMKESSGIFERCPQSTHDIFWQNLVESKVVTADENTIFEKLYKYHSWNPDVIIFIDKSPEKCYEHIQSRNQTGDTGVSMNYLKSLDVLYTKHFKNNDKIHVIDGNQSIPDVTRDILKIINPILSKSSSETWNGKAHLHPLEHDVYM
jgi:deoxyadenosine/deoxycytidine kinase